MLLALACGLAAGAIAVGSAWGEKRHVLAIMIATALLAGEGYALLLTGERILEQREAKQAPMRAAMASQEHAEDRVKAAEVAMADLATTQRLGQAIGAKRAADLAAVEKAAERGCASNCRVLLEQQVAEASAEVAAARAELATLRQTAEAELSAARTALSLLPAPASASPLADRLGVPGWQIDLAAAVLASVAANGLGAFLLAFAAHGQRGASVPPLERPLAAETASRDAMAEANRFAFDTFRPASDHRLKLADVRVAYRVWCASAELEPLADREIGAALSSLFDRVGLYREGSGTEAVIVGIGWAAPSRELGRAVALSHHNNAIRLSA